MAFKKADPVEAMATGSLLTCSVTGIYVMTNIGFPPVVGTFSSCSCMIMLDALSYTNFFGLGTSFGMKRVQSPKFSALNHVCPLASTVDISGISVSIGTISLFLASSSFFLCSSSVALSVASFATLCVASATAFSVVVASVVAFFYGCLLLSFLLGSCFCCGLCFGFGFGFFSNFPLFLSGVILFLVNLLFLPSFFIRHCLFFLC